MALHNNSHKHTIDERAAHDEATTDGHMSRRDDCSNTHGDQVPPSHRTITSDTTVVNSRQATLFSALMGVSEHPSTQHRSASRQPISVHDDPMQDVVSHAQQDADRHLINELYGSMSPRVRGYYGVGAEQQSRAVTARNDVAITSWDTNPASAITDTNMTSTQSRSWMPPSYLSNEQQAFNSQLTAQALPSTRTAEFSSPPHPYHAQRFLDDSLNATAQLYGGPRLIATSNDAYWPLSLPRSASGLGNVFHQAAQSFNGESCSTGYEGNWMRDTTSPPDEGQHDRPRSMGMHSLSHAMAESEPVEDDDTASNTVPYEQHARSPPGEAEESDDIIQDRMQPAQSNVLFQKSRSSSQSHPEGTVHRPKKQEEGEKAKKRSSNAKHSKLFEDAPTAATALPKMVIGAYELLAYFPKHTQWPAAIVRLICNDWTTDNISAAQLFARGNQDGDDHYRRAGTIRHHILLGGQEFFRLANFSRMRYPSLMHHREMGDASSWKPRSSIATLHSARLVTLAENVINAPLGQDRGVVTQAIELAVRDARLDWHIGDIPSVVQQYGLQMPTEAASISSWDVNARDRLRSRLDAAGGFGPRVDTL